MTCMPKPYYIMALRVYIIYYVHTRISKRAYGARRPKITFPTPLPRVRYLCTYRRSTVFTVHRVHATEAESEQETFESTDLPA